MSEGPRLVASLVPASTGRPALVGIGGGVSVGKSTFAAAVRAELGGRVDVVSTDGFLFPNSVLGPRGLAARKGFPETYDVEALRSFLAAARAGDLPRSVPRYSHVTYDVDGSRAVGPLDVLIVEGLHVLGQAADLLDLAVYLDASEEQLEAWYRERFLELVDEARRDPSSFYRSFTGLGAEEILRLADRVWWSVNLPNLREHVAPSRDRASVVITTAGPDHAVVSVERRRERATEGS